MARFLSVWAGTPFPIDLVTSDSMNPSLMSGDVVAWTPIKIEDIKVGEVIVFKSYLHWPDEKIVVHRVVEITHASNGEILIGTKGDNNNWTDQAGPHLPEPYIRDDNIMGKVVSIGNQPLKIPFIGYIGILINDGLRLLTQPTSSKDTLSYIGIFTPLTISAVILVILIFILPEKGRTVKEKLKLYIFGAKPLKIKRTFILFFVAYIAFFTVIHIFAYDQTTASIGINDDSQKSGLNFGRIKQNTESFPRELPLINPGAFPVKGILYGQGEMKDFIPVRTFQLERGETRSDAIIAIANNDSKNGSFFGQVMIYSSPFWILFPDDFIKGFLNLNSELTVFILDLLSAIILTLITMSILLILSFIFDFSNIYLINQSWKKPGKLIIKRNVILGFSKFKNNAKRWVGLGAGWLLKIDFSEQHRNENLFKRFGKPVLAASSVVPFIIIYPDPIVALVFSVIIGGAIAYFISCKLRYKIILTALIIISIAFSSMIIKSNIIILSKDQTFLESLAVSFGVAGVYTLIFSLLLVPLVILAWLLTRFFRNLKERKDPLLSLEGSCDL